ncbi:MAG: carbohydrate kinase family protein, partial [Oscillibacter sp.]|nr:carbohydrate kinase family protein [Oscillibacter sp.]
GALRLGESNVGTVRTSPGGVARNVAHNLALLGVRTRLVTAYGDDDRGRILRDACRRAGVDDGLSPVFAGERTSAYLYLTERDGEMHAAVNDMAICERLTPALLDARMAAINESDAVVTDANLPEETLAYLAEHCAAPLIADAVSETKCRRLKGILWKLHAIKPNRSEIAALTGVSPKCEADFRRAAEALRRAGTERVYLSLGAEGLYVSVGEENFLTPVIASNIVSTTGAGDAMTAALVWAELQGLSPAETARAALAAASITMESAETVHPALNERALRARAEIV